MITDQVIRPHTIHGEASTVLRNRDIVCFSHDWTGDPLSKTHLMRLLAHDNRILWVNSIGYRAPSATRADVSRAFRKLSSVATPLREVERNLFVMNPLAIPAYGNPVLRDLSRHLLRIQVRRAMRRLGFQRAINWVFNPAAGLLAGELGEEMLIYHCVDEYTAFTGVASHELAAIESRLLELADLVFVSAKRLYQNKSPANPNTFLVRHGVDFHHFARALKPETVVPEAIAGLPRPILGYFGLIADDWVDLDLLIHVAEQFPRGSLVMLGKVTMDVSRLAALPNVHFLGRQPYASLPSYCKGFDAALIPFPISEVTLNANPLKAREYLAAGLPVISTAIPEVEELSQCRIGRDAQSFVAEIEDSLRNPGPRVSRSQSVRDESWQSRLEEIRDHFTTHGSLGRETTSHREG